MQPEKHTHGHVAACSLAAEARRAGGLCPRPCTPAIPVPSQGKTGRGPLACSQTGWESDLPPSEGLPYLSPWGISSRCGFSHPSEYWRLRGVPTAELRWSPGLARSLPALVEPLLRARFGQQGDGSGNDIVMVTGKVTAASQHLQDLGPDGGQRSGVRSALVPRRPAHRTQGALGSGVMAPQPSE